MSSWLNGGAAVLEGDGRIVAANDALAAWLGSPADGLAGQALPKLLGQRYPEWEDALRQFLKTASNFDWVELSSPANQGDERLAVEAVRHGRARFLRLESGPALPVTRPATPATRPLAEPVPAQKHFEDLLVHCPVLIFSQRPDMSFSFVSSRIEQWTGVPVDEWRAGARNFWEAVHEADARSLAERLRGENQTPEGQTGTYRIRHVKTGRITYVWEYRKVVRDRDGVVLGFEGVAWEITRQAIAERRLTSVSWRENLGILSVGLAHDFCNLMTGIVGLTQTFEAGSPPDGPLGKGLKMIRETALQASQLAQRIRRLHQNSPGEKSYQDLNETVSGLVDLLGNVLPRSVRIRSESAPGQLPIYVDLVELQQVIVNLALNAADAMPGGGELVFRTCALEEVPALSHLVGTRPLGPAVQLSVQDSGAGIPQRLLGLIFEPFFTTKTSHKGSGLGLYNARLFAEKHSAAISVETREGSGTTFLLFFTRASFDETERVTEIETAARQTFLAVGLAGDALDRLVRLLREGGYYVVPASNEAEAMEAFLAPDLQLNALIMLCPGPGTEDQALCRRIREQKFPLKMILATQECQPQDLDPALVESVELLLPLNLPSKEFLTRIKQGLSTELHRAS